jgi:hypothetical protein
MLGKARPKARFLNQKGGNTGFSRQLRNSGVSDIGANEDDACGETAGPDSFVNSAKIRALAGAEHTKAKLMHRGLHEHALLCLRSQACLPGEEVMLFDEKVGLPASRQLCKMLLGAPQYPGS